MKSKTGMTSGMAACLALLGACAANEGDGRHYPDPELASVRAVVETEPVQSVDDAADDPAIWINRADPLKSLILGTDKDAGLGIYNLDGSLKQFIPAGLPNNVDLRQGVRLGSWRGDLAAASNRDGDQVTLFSINAEGGEIVASFPARLPEPYGSCMGMTEGVLTVFVTYKTGEVHAHQLRDLDLDTVRQEVTGAAIFSSQLEGCVHDDANAALYVGEEGRGLWKMQTRMTGGRLELGTAALVDEIGSGTGLVADVEGVSLYAPDSQSGYIILSSQGDDSYAIYDRNGHNRFIGRFRVVADEASGIDGAQETDGLDATAFALGPDFPEGVLVVQDGFNAPAGSTQNFKIIDWRTIRAALQLQ